MIARLAESDGDRWAGWPLSATASGIAAGTPTPAATAPNTDVFTKSRRENVTDSSQSVSPARLNHAPLRDEHCCRRNPEGYHGRFTGDAPAVVSFLLGGGESTLEPSDLPHGRKEPQKRGSPTASAGGGGSA